MRNLIYTYRQQPEIGWSTAEVLEQPNPAVLAHVCREKSGWAMVALHNFGADSSIVPIQLQACRRDAPSSTCLTDSPSTNWIPRAGSTSTLMAMTTGGCA